MITVRDILATEAFENTKVVAGLNGLDNMISSITVAEVPDAADWLRGNELVCTTGFFIKDNTVSQVRWIERLIEHGAMALAIKKNRFLGGISKSIISIANNKNFPLIELPQDLTWPYVIESVMNRIAAEQVRQLKQAEEINTHLTQLVLDGESIQTIASVIASFVDNPIIVEDGKFNMLAKGLPEKQGNDVQRALQLKVIDNRIDNNFKSEMLQSEFYRKVVYTKQNKQYKYKIYNNTINTITLPIIASNIVYGFVTLVQCNDPYSKDDISILEQGLTAIALQLVKNDIAYNKKISQSQQAIDAMIQGRIHGGHFNQFIPIDFDFSLPMVAVCVKKNEDVNKKNVYVAAPPDEFIKTCIANTLSKIFHCCLIGQNEGMYTILISYNSKQNNIVDQIEKSFKEILEKIKENLGYQKLIVGIGGIYSELGKLEKSYEDAQKALEIIESNSFFTPVLSYDNLGVHRILSLVPYQELKSFCEDYLSVLIEFDNKTGDGLCDTLSEYLKSNGNITITAKKMFVHPNTISYRLKKIQKMLPKPLNSHEFRLSLELALEIKEMLIKFD